TRIARLGALESKVLDKFSTLSEWIECSVILDSKESDRITNQVVCFGTHLCQHMALHQAAFACKHGGKGDVIERRCGSNCKCRFQNLCYSTTKTFFAIYEMQNSILILLIAVSNVV